MSVPLPPPEGELMTKRMPCSNETAAGDLIVSAFSVSLNVLYLFAQLFRFRFDGERGLFDREIS